MSDIKELSPELRWLGNFSQRTYDHNSRGNFRNSHVVHLTAQNFGFDRIIHKDFSSRYNDRFGLVVFYRPDCRWCHAMENEFCKAAEYCQGIIPFGAIDASNKTNSQLLTKYHITKFPTVRVVQNGFLFTEFRLPAASRTKSQFIRFVCDHIPDNQKNNLRLCG